MRAIRYLSLSLLLLLLPQFAEASLHGSVIDIQRQLRMSEADPIPPKDIFLDVGGREGLRVGDLVPVHRSVMVLNRESGQPDGTVRVMLGTLKLIAVGEANSVGRLQPGTVPAELPAMDSQEIMLGDEVDIGARTGLPTP